MKTVLTRLTDEQAKKEVEQFTYLGIALALAGLFAFWLLATAGLAFSARGLLLTWHKANKGKTTVYRILAALGVVISLAILILYYAPINND